MNRLKAGLLVIAVLICGVLAYLQPAVPRSTPPPPTATNLQSWGSRIAAGHAFAKHGAEFGFTARAELAAHIDRIIASPSASRHLSRGREAYWDDATGTVVICDPSTADGGTAFKPDRGRKYYEGLR